MFVVHDKRERGRKGDDKCMWGIENNEARDTYPSHYNTIDAINHMIKNVANKFISLKYWHLPYVHELSLGVIPAHDMYVECCEGLLEQSWFVVEKKRMIFDQFQMKRPACLDRLGH